MVEPGISRLVGARWGEGVAIGIGTVVSFSLVTFIHIVLGEQAPKTFAIRNPERAALMSARIMDAFTRIFRPVIWLLDGATTLVLRLFGVAGASGHHSVYSADELKMLVRESQAEGVLEQTQDCLLYTSDAADDLLCVDLGGRRIIKKKKHTNSTIEHNIHYQVA